MAAELAFHARYAALRGSAHVIDMTVQIERKQFLGALISEYRRAASRA